MIYESSGKFFRFKLDFDLGFAFAEVYDFTDIHSADGIKAFVYNRIDSEPKKSYKLSEITSSGIGLGPITLYRYPNARGIGAWKYLFKTDNYIIDEPPVTKESQGFAPLVFDWDVLSRWYKSDWDIKKTRVYVPYSQVRSLETSILNSSTGVVKKATMKYLIDQGNTVKEYYDLSELGNRNMFIQLVNTYYPIERARSLIELIPADI